MLKLVNLTNIQTDSRGVKLQERDCVLYFILDNVPVFGVVQKDDLFSNVKKVKTFNNIPNVYTGMQAYCIKLDSLTDYSYTVIHKKYMKDYPDTTDSLRSYIYVPKYLLSEHKTKNTIKRDMFQTVDYMLRDIHVGDLVLYVSNNALKYGIMISKTHLVNQEGKRIRVNFVCLIEEKTKEEEHIFGEISIANGMVAQSVSLVNVTPKIGEVYTSNSYYFIYLGHINMTYNYKNKSNVAVDLNYDITKPFWLKLKYDGELYNNLKHVTLDYLVTTVLEKYCVLEDSECNINSCVVAYYKTLKSFRCLVQEPKSKVMKNGVINVINQITCDFSYVLGDLKMEFRLS